MCPSFHSLVVSPKLEPSTDPYPPHHSLGPHVDFTSLVSPLHHTNPFCQSQTSSPVISPCNPFFSHLQHNPFFEDMLTTQHLKHSLPPLPYLSSSRPPIAQLFPRASNPNPTLTHDNPTTDDSIMDSDAESGSFAEAEKQPLPRGPTEGEKPSSKKFLNPFIPAREPEADSEWDESFEAFAAGRLQSPKNLTTDWKTQQNPPGDYPEERCSIKGVLLPITDADQNTNVHKIHHSLPLTEFVFEAHKAISQATNSNRHHLDTFAQMLETIPEHLNLENENVTLNTSESQNLDACTVINQDTSDTNTNDLTNTNMHQVPCHTSSAQLNSSSPDPGSSGLGSSAEEDFLSCVSSYSDKFSASSSEEPEAQIIESNILGFEKSSELAKSKPLDYEDDITGRSDDLSLVSVTLQTAVQLQDSNKIPDSDSQRSFSPHQVLVTAGKMGTESVNAQTLDICNVEDECKEKGINELMGSIIDFSQEVNKDPADLQVIISGTMDDNLSSTIPLLSITTSSPSVGQSLSDSPFEGTSLAAQDTSHHSPLPFGPFGDFLNTSPVQDLNSSLLNTQGSDQRSSSSLQSLYVSTDSQVYQNCESKQTSKYFSVSEPNEVLSSANSTHCGELNEIQMTSGAASGLEDSNSANRPYVQENSQTDRFEEFFCGAENNKAAVEPGFTIGDDFQVPLAAQTESSVWCNPRKISERGVERQHVISNCPQAQSAPLHRSHSEGTLTPAFDDFLLPSFGSDPGAIKESSTAQSSPDRPCLPSSAPYLTPKNISSPVALRSLPPLASALVNSPSSAARDATPKPVRQETQQQQQLAENLQKR